MLWELPCSVWCSKFSNAAVRLSSCWHHSWNHMILICQLNNAQYHFKMQFFCFIYSLNLVDCVFCRTEKTLWIVVAVVCLALLSWSFCSWPFLIVLPKDQFCKVWQLRYHSHLFYKYIAYFPPVEAVQKWSSWDCDVAIVIICWIFSQIILWGLWG